MNRHHIRAVLFDFNGVVTAGGEVFPDVVPLLHKLKAEGSRLAVYSEDNTAEATLNALKLAAYFDAIIAGSDKLDSELFTNGAEAVGVHPFHCLVFAATSIGVEAARLAGMKCVGLGDAATLSEAPSVIVEYSEIDVEALLDSARPFRPEPHGWNLVESEFRSSRSLYWESMLAVTNGVLGVRGNLEEENEGVESYPATLMNGVIGFFPYFYMWKFSGFPERGHCVLNACEWTKVQLEVDGERFHISHPGLKKHRRWLDMKTGVMHREFVWETSSGVEVTVRSRRMASMVRRHLAALEYSVEVSKPCNVRLQTATDCSPKSRHFGKEGFSFGGWQTRNGVLCARQTAVSGGQQVASGFRVLFSEGNSEPQRDGAVSVSSINVAAVPGKPVTLEKTAVFYSDLETDAGTLDAAVDRELAEAPAPGGLVEEQSKFWKDYWNIADVQIDGDAMDQLGVRLSLFHNRQSNPEDGFRSISANGLTGDNYAGHVFWDTEMYIAMPFLYSEPATARGLLEYRYRILDKARERARQLGRKGAEYSWNSVNGEECGHVFEAATGQHHLQSDIAWAVDRYVDASGDREFLYTMGAEIVFETARFLRDRGAFSDYKGGFVLNAVCGPNEYGCGVDNNAYTNYMMQWHFETAARFFEEMKKEAPGILSALCERIGLTEEEAADWKKTAACVYLPWDEKLGIVPQDDAFLGHDPVDMSKIPLHTDIRTLVHPLDLWRMQLIKQADTVLLMYLHRDKFDDETVRRCYEYYEPKTNHGSSLSACMHAIVAADIGLLDDAYHFFRESSQMDINDLKSNTGGGVHSACLGGTWMAVVNGFGGMRDEKHTLKFRPQLPEKWTRLSFQLVWHGTRIGVEMKQDAVTYRHLGGPVVTFGHCGQTVQLDEGDEKQI
ncbi:MAG: HAD hydrolase-like protein [Kiritimatiellales bacterium]|nr:HAD hydrolase-like protein [Kiritimatiellales bacterium]